MQDEEIQVPNLTVPLPRKKHAGLIHNNVVACQRSRQRHENVRPTMPSHVNALSGIIPSIPLCMSLTCEERLSDGEDDGDAGTILSVTIFVLENEVGRAGGSLQVMLFVALMISRMSSTDRGLVAISGIFSDDWMVYAG